MNSSARCSSIRSAPQRSGRRKRGRIRKRWAASSAGLPSRACSGSCPIPRRSARPAASSGCPTRVVQELQRLKGLYTGFGARELARIIFHTTMHRLTGQTARRLWDRLPPAAPPPRPLLDYHSHPDRYQARLEVITLYAQGWNKSSISRFLQVSRPTVALWIRRLSGTLAGLEDKSRAPQTPARKVWLPLMIEVYHLQKRHPDAGEFRIWSLLANDDHFRPHGGPDHGAQQAGV